MGGGTAGPAASTQKPKKCIPSDSHHGRERRVKTELPWCSLASLLHASHRKMKLPERRLQIGPWKMVERHLT